MRKFIAYFKGFWNKESTKYILCLFLALLLFRICFLLIF